MACCGMNKPQQQEEPSKYSIEESEIINSLAQRPAEKKDHHEVGTKSKKGPKCPESKCPFLDEATKEECRYKSILLS